MRFTAFFVILTALASMPAAASDLDAKFLIKREGKVIGYHNVDITKSQSETIVETDIEMRIKFGPIPLFKYRHQSRELWRGNELLELKSETDYDGEDMWARAVRRDGFLYIDGSAFQGKAPEGAIPSSYWNKDLISADALINTQNGKIIDIGVEPNGKTQAPNNWIAEQYRVTGTLTLDIWYDGPRWVGSNFTVDGEELSYVLVVNEQHMAALQEFLD